MRGVWELGEEGIVNTVGCCCWGAIDTATIEPDWPDELCTLNWPWRTDICWPCWNTT